MNALELLKQDHEKVAELFEEFKANEDGDNSELFEKINSELEMHTHIEETIFYPRLEADGDDELKKIVLEGIEEHGQVKTLLSDLPSLIRSNDEFNAKLKVLVEDVEHHVEEEEGEMFPLIEAQFDESELEEWGGRMEDEKAGFRKAAATGR